MSRHPLANLLTAYLDGELPAPEQGAVERHLERCPRCRAEADSLRLSGEPLHLLAMADPGPAALEDLRQRLAAAPARPRRLAWVAAAVVATAGAALLLSLGHRAPAPTPRPSSVVTAQASPKPSPSPPPLQRSLHLGDVPRCRDLPLKSVEDRWAIGAHNPIAGSSIAIARANPRPRVAIAPVRFTHHHFATTQARRAAVRPARAVQHDEAPAIARPSPGPATTEMARDLTAAAGPPATGLVLLLGSPEPVLPSASCYLEVSFSDGAKSISEQSIQRDVAGEPRAMRISYSQIAPEHAALPQGG